MKQIYMWKEITNEALPYFEDINQADETWIWEVVQKNLEEYEISYEKMGEKAKELFGSNFNKGFPKEGTENLIYNEENNLYYATSVELDQQEDAFLLNKIDKIKNGYEVEIIEYLEDYSQAITENQIIIRNVEGQEVAKISIQEEGKINEIVKNSTEKLNKKKIVLKLENGKLQVERVYQ